jgi:citrate lyase beta subunit
MPSLAQEAQAELERLAAANRAFALSYPGEPSTRQPVHTVYGGAQLYRAETTRRLGELALAAMRAYAPDPLEFARGVGFLPEGALAALDLGAIERARLAPAPSTAGADRHAWLAAHVYDRVVEKLEREAVEDFRIDFEDGFGARPDREEDEVAVRTAREVARGLAERLLPPFLGIRIKSLGEEWKLRALRTLELFLDTLLVQSAGTLPQNFVVTLPKITVPEQPRCLVRLFERLEARHALAPGSLRLELMIETTQALIGPNGVPALAGLFEACEGRCAGAHLGTYDLTAACNVTAAQQGMRHPLCDLAKGLMTFAFAGTGVFLSDGATNVMPVGPHRGPELGAQELAENRAAVHGAWRVAHDDIRHSLEGGYYQGWDLHPAQLPVRYATCFAFFLEGLAPAALRLRTFVEKAAQATLVGDIFDDAATGQGLLNYFLRALNSGAITLEEAAATGLTPEEFGLRSFAKILAARRERTGG